MFKIVNKSEQEMLVEKNELVKLPLIKVCSGIVNIFDKDNNLIVADATEWTNSIRSIETGSGYRLIAIPVNAERCAKWFPVASIQSAWQFDSGYVVLVDNELWIIAGKYYNYSGYELSNDNGYSIIDKVKVCGRFSPIVAPGYGLIIRSMLPYDFIKVDKNLFPNPFDKIKNVDNNFGFNDSLDTDSEVSIIHNFSLYLVQGKDQIDPRDLIEGYAQCIDSLDSYYDCKYTLNELLENWKYPNVIKDFYNGSLKIIDPKTNRCIGLRYTSTKVSYDFKENTGIVSIYLGDSKNPVEFKCYPGLELPFAKALSMK